MLHIRLLATQPHKKNDRVKSTEMPKPMHCDSADVTMQRVTIPALLAKGEKSSFEKFVRMKKNY